MKRVLVTGGSGFIGTNLVESLIRRGDVVLNVDIAPPRNADHRPLWCKLDLGDREGVRGVVKEFAPEYVFHCAARTDLGSDGPDEYRINVEGTENLFDALERVKGTKRVLAVSSMLVCRLGYVPRREDEYCPNTAYGASKAEAERRVRARRTQEMPWVIARPTSIWGPWFGAPYRDFFLTVARGRFRAPRGWTARRSMGFVGNTTHQLVCLAEASDATVAGGTFYLCDYEPICMGDWSRSVAAALDVRPPPAVSTGLLRVAARAGSLLEALGVMTAPLTNSRLNNMLTDAVFDTSALESLCGALPYGTAQGIVQTVEWMREQRLI